MTDTAVASPPPSAAPPRGSGAAFRVVDAGALVTLERLQASDAMQGGHVSLIAFDALAEGLGLRWRHECDRVHTHAEKALHNRLGKDGFCQRISQTDYVVVQPGAGRLAAQLLCIDNHARKPCSTFAWAERRRPALIVHEVTRVTAEGVFGERIDAEEAALAADRRARRAAEAGGAGLAGPLGASSSPPTAAPSGSRCQLEPVFQLKTSERDRLSGRPAGCCTCRARPRSARRRAPQPGQRRHRAGRFRHPLARSRPAAQRGRSGPPADPDPAGLVHHALQPQGRRRPSSTISRKPSRRSATG